MAGRPGAEGRRADCLQEKVHVPRAQGPTVCAGSRVPRGAWTRGPHSHADAPAACRARRHPVLCPRRGSPPPVRPVHPTG